MCAPEYVNCSSLPFSKPSLKTGVLRKHHNLLKLLWFFQSRGPGGKGPGEQGSSVPFIRPAQPRGPGCWGRGSGGLLTFPAARGPRGEGHLEAPTGDYGHHPSGGLRASEDLVCKASSQSLGPLDRLQGGHGGVWTTSTRGSSATSQMC